jgi:hypothetical protein
MQLWDSIDHMSTQYRLVQSGKTASGGCSAGPRFVRACSATDLFLFIYYVGCNMRHRAVPWLRSLVAGLSPPRPGSIHVGFVVDKVALGQVFL